jgi:aurora kinase
VAVKKIDKNTLKTPKMKETLKREIQIQKQLKHVNIVRLYTSLEDDRYIYLILEYVKQGNLFFIIRKKGVLSEAEAFYFFIQAVAGIYFLHKHGFIHRDLKPENLLVAQDNVLKICDFGWCVEATTEKSLNNSMQE